AAPNPRIPSGFGKFPAGRTAPPSNIDTGTRDRFSVLPSLQLRLGYVFTQRSPLVFGYDILDWNQVVRLRNLVNHVVNLTQNAVLDPNGRGVLVGPAQPAPLFQRSDFWAQGISLGLECRY